MTSSAAVKALTASAGFPAASTSVSASFVSFVRHCRPLTCAATASRIAPAPPDLIRWIRREGGFVHPKLKIASGSVESLGLGVVAAGDIPAGSELIALPSHIPLRFDRSPAEASDGSGDGPRSSLMELIRRIPKELWAMRLGLRLLQERATVGSFWWPYISNLPEAFSVPIFFSGEDIKNLQYAPLIHQVNKRCRFLLGFEKEVTTMLENISSNAHPFGGQNVNASSLGWAMSAVSSRAFRLHGQKHSNDAQVDIPMLLPLIDMCNHSFSPSAQIVQDKDINNPNMLVKVVAETDLREDTSVTLNYGCLNNDFFLLDYGFVIPSNPYDHVDLTYDEALLDSASIAAGLSFPSFSSPAHWQQEILSQLNLKGDGALLKVTLGGTEIIDGRLLAALRVLLSSDKEAVQGHDLNTLKLFSEEAPLGVPIEVAALRTLIALSVVALKHFPTEIMQDESILKQDVSRSTELAVQFRMQKKLLLIEVMRRLTQKVKKISKMVATS